MKPGLKTITGGVLVSLLLCSCTTMREDQGASTAAAPQKAETSPTVTQREISGPVSQAQSASVPLKEVFKGTGEFIDRRAAANKGPADTEGEVTLNFQDSSLAEVVKTVLGDILNLNYVIGSDVNGSVSMRTARPISRDALIPTLENLLRVNGAALVKNQDFYEVVMVDEAAALGVGASTRLTADRGYQVLIVPLRYVGVKEMQKILETVKSARSKVIVDEYRNILLLAGTYGDLHNMRETVNIFDVDQLKGMSVGMFRLENVDAPTIVGELESVFGDTAEGPLAGLVRFTVIDRLNALLVITPQEKYLASAEQWINRLDQAENPHGVNMYVYYVENGKAENLAELLGQLFETKRRSAVAKANAQVSQGNVAAEPTADAAASPKVTGDRTNQQVTSLEVGDVTIMPDLESNALLILATPTDYAEVEKAIKKLDVLPLQVLVEASIVEVSLDDQLQYGLQWFFKDRHGRKSGTGGLGIPNSGKTTTTDSDGNIVSALSGALSDPADFTYAIFDGMGTRAVLNAIAADSRLNVLSSPSLMVLDNQTATIRVGDQVPIRTSETSNTSGLTTVNNIVGSTITSQIQYRDTGVTLEVTPRVNSGGMVVLDITQRVDDVDETTTSGIDSPTILQREIQTSVAVQSGETIVLGGLIREDKQESDSGVPFLKDIPGLGLLFSGKQISKNKTELVVMITPRAIASTEDARRVTDEYRSKLKDVDLSSLRR